MVEPQVAPEAEKTVIEPTPAPVVDIEGLQAKLSKLETELEQTKKGLSTAHQTLTQKDRELKSQADLRAEIRGIREDMELLAVVRATGDETEPPDRANRQNVLAELQKRRAASEAKLKADAEALSRQEYNQKADAIYAQAQTLLEGEDLKDIENLLLSNNLVLAQREVRLASKSKPSAPKVEPPKETDDARVARLVKEQLIKDYPDLYKSDNNSPGGSITSPAEAMSQYAEGKITAEEAKKRGVNFD